MIDTIYRDEAIEAVCGVVIDEFDVSPTKGYEVSEHALSELPSAGPQTGELISREEPTVIRSRTFMPTNDFKEWAKRIREVNPNAVVIPCDAEVVSAEAAQGWIPCSERLPDAENGESDRVLVTCIWESDYPKGTRWIRMLYFDGGNWCYPTGECFTEKVVAWMPLPPSYKGE